MKLSFDYYRNLESIDLFLLNPDGRELLPITARGEGQGHLTLRFNDLSALSFVADEMVTLSNGTSTVQPAYSMLATKRIVLAKGVGFFQVTEVQETDTGVARSKSVTCESLQSVLKNMGFRTEDRVYCLYNADDPYDKGLGAMEITNSNYYHVVNRSRTE